MSVDLHAKLPFALKRKLAIRCLRGSLAIFWNTWCAISLVTAWRGRVGDACCRSLAYQGSLGLRIVSADNLIPECHGKVEIGLRRRIRGLDSDQRVGECLAIEVSEIHGGEWQSVDFRLA